MPRMKAIKTDSASEGQTAMDAGSKKSKSGVKKTIEKATTEVSKAGRGKKKAKVDIENEAPNEADIQPPEENSMKTNGRDKNSKKSKVEATEETKPKRGTAKKNAVENEKEEKPKDINTKTKAPRRGKKPNEEDKGEVELNAEEIKKPSAGRKRKGAAAVPILDTNIEQGSNVKAEAKSKAARGKKLTTVEAGPTDKREAVKKKAPVKKVEKPMEEESKSVAKKTTGRKRAAAKADDDENAQETDAKPSKAKKALMNPTETSYNKADFDISDMDGNTSNTSNSGVERKVLKISSWNVAGLRSWLKKDGLKYLDYEEPDIFCMQEIKCTPDQMPEEAKRIPGYHPYWLCLPGGYAGVALYSKIMPINVEYGIGDKEFDATGRLITAEYEKFFLVNVYVPNSGRKLVNLDARMRWEKLFQSFVQRLDERKPVIICGDMNVSHQEIDLANPKSNTRNAGFTIEERDKMTELLSLGFIDTFRDLYPNKTGAYTYWTYMAKARLRNVGWRLDYFIVSERIAKRVIENAIRSQVLGSDHCPITLFINI